MKHRGACGLVAILTIGWCVQSAWSDTPAPKPDNAIYHVADALSALQKFSFPFELNPVTREYFAAIARIETGQDAADIRAILQDPPEAQALERLSQRATANINCRIFPNCRITGLTTRAMPPLRADIMKSLRDVGGKLWPGTTVIPIMETGASDSIYTMGWSSTTCCSRN